MFSNGVALLENGDTRAALDEFEKSLAEAQGDQRADSLYNIAVCQVRLGNVDGALNTLAQVVAIDPALAADIRTDTDFASLATDERFQTTLAGTALTEPAVGTVDATPAASPAGQDTDEEIKALKKTTDWFIAIRTNAGKRLLYEKSLFSTALRQGILDGAIGTTTTIDVHAKQPNGPWSKTTTPLAQFAKGHFALRVLHEPVRSHASEGLKWGALIGVGLKLLDTLISLANANPGLALLFLMAIGLCFFRAGMVLVVVASIGMAQVSRANFFVIGLAAALSGAILGCLPGMAVGGIVGLSRRRSLPLAVDAVPEPDDLLLKTVVYPALGAAAIWAFYLLVFNPWAAGLMGTP